ncbi:MAG: zinc ribbon domain-containing protein [bacterium]
MPIYEYKCKRCGTKFEYLHGAGGSGSGEATCPACGGKTLEKQFSSFSVSKLPSFGGGRTCCDASTPEAASCDVPGSCCSKGK